MNHRHNTSTIAVAWRAVALLSSCGGCGLRVHNLPDGRTFPDDWASCPIQPQEGDRDSSNRRLEFDALYVMEPFTYGEYGELSDWEMSYYRFWPGGQVMRKPRFGRTPDRSVPTAAEADDFSGRTTGVGRYSVNGNELTMAFLGYDEGGWRWSRLYARLNADGSFNVHGYGDRGYQRFDRPRPVRKEIVQGMRRSPDW